MVKPIDGTTVINCLQIILGPLIVMMLRLWNVPYMLFIATPAPSIGICQP